MQPSIRDGRVPALQQWQLFILGKLRGSYLREWLNGTNLYTSCHGDVERWWTQDKESSRPWQNIIGRWESGLVSYDSFKHLFLFSNFPFVLHSMCSRWIRKVLMPFRFPDGDKRCVSLILSVYSQTAKDLEKCVTCWYQRLVRNRISSS